MKLLSKIIFIFLPLYLLDANLFGQYVTLEGRQFKKPDGSDFYPMVMNYEVGITTSGTGYYGTPAGNHGHTSDYECIDESTCNNRFQIEFAKVKAMGFNSVRVFFGLHYRYDLASNTRIFSVAYNDNVIPLYTTTSHWLDLDYPNFTNQAAQDYFNIIINFLDQAEIADVKVILLTAENEEPGVANGNIYFNPVYDAAASSAYATYLAKLAGMTGNHPALLAYDLWNEPLYTHMYKDSTGASLKKQDVCGYVKDWYDAIRANDPNHLITLGGSSVDEMFFWDMGILKLDFYSLHAYPKYNPFLWPTDVQGSIASGMEHFKIICYWMSQVCPMPWIIGETGFAADDNSVPSTHLDSDPNTKLPPLMYGSESQQALFAYESLHAVRNSLGSGYSWWKFQNSAWYSPTSPCWPEGCGNENFFGLLHYGDNTTPTWHDKQAVSVFDSYPDPPPAPGANPQPSDYYDPYKIKSSLNTNAINAISGKVYDEKGNPIKDAVIKCTSWLYSDDYLHTPLDNTDDKFYWSTPFTFSKSDGSFEIVPYNYYQPNAADPHRIVNIDISAVGAARYHEGPEWIYDWGPGEQQMPPLINSDIYLKKVTTGFDAIASNEIVNIAETRNYYGWNTLTASNMTIDGDGSTGGNSDFTAREEILLTAGFDAKYGSEVKIFTSEVYPDCVDFTGFFRLANPLTSNQVDNSNQTNEIELSFVVLNKLNAEIFPNPNSGLFTINIHNPLKDQVTITVNNLVGDLLWKIKTPQSIASCNFNFLPKGVYLLNINNEQEYLIKKIIIN